MSSTKHRFSEHPQSSFTFSEGLSPRKTVPPEQSDLRSRFMRSCPDSVVEEELLELILHRAVAPVDARPLARRLIGTLGDFNRVIASSASRLKQILGVNDQVIQELKIVQAAAHRMARVRVMDREVLSSWTDLLDYCQTRMAHLEREQFRVLYLDRKNVLIADEVIQNGTVDHVPVYPREIIKQALELNASALILVHNHPSGDATPSEADIEMTHTIKSGGDALGITLHDHLVIGKGQTFSFQSHGLL